MIRIATLIFDDNAYRRVQNAFRYAHKAVETIFFDNPADLVDAITADSTSASGASIDAVIIELHDPEGKSTSYVVQRIHRRFPELPIVAYMDHSPQRVRELLVAVRAGVSEVILREYDDLPQIAGMILRMVEAVKVSHRVLGALSENFGHVPEWIPAFISCVIRNAYLPSGISKVEMELGRNRKSISSNLASAGMPGAGRIMAWGRKLVDANMLDESTAGSIGDGGGSGGKTSFDRLLGAFIEEISGLRESRELRAGA